MNSNNHPKQFYKLAISLILAIFIGATFFQPSAGKEVEVTFGETKVENFFPKGIRFSIKIDINDHRGIVTFHYRLGKDSWSYDSAKCSAKINNDNKVEYYSCIYYLDTTGLPPQLPISYKWQLYGSVDRTSEEENAIYENPSFDWESLTANNMTIWWHDRSSEYAGKIFTTASVAIQKQQEFYGIELDYPVLIVIQNNEEEFQEWRGKDPRPIIGDAYPRLGIITEIANLDVPENFSTYLVAELVSHQISHLYFYQATERGQANPPNWLDDGLAGYHEKNNYNKDWSLVNSAIENDALIPLGELRGEFTGEDEKISLSYAESTTAIIYAIETYGQEGVNKLFSAYQAGESSDEAFLKAFGRTESDFEKDWEVWVVERANQPSNTIKVLSYVLFSMAITCSCTLASIFVIIFLIIAFNNKVKIQPVPRNME